MSMLLFYTIEGCKKCSTLVKMSSLMPVMTVAYFTPTGDSKDVSVRVPPFRREERTKRNKKVMLVQLLLKVSFMRKRKKNDFVGETCSN